MWLRIKTICMTAWYPHKNRGAAHTAQLLLQAIKYWKYWVNGAHQRSIGLMPYFLSCWCHWTFGWCGTSYLFLPLSRILLDGLGSFPFSHFSFWGLLSLHISYLLFMCGSGSMRRVIGGGKSPQSNLNIHALATGKIKSHYRFWIRPKSRQYKSPKKFHCLSSDNLRHECCLKRIWCPIGLKNSNAHSVHSAWCTSWKISMQLPVATVRSQNPKAIPCAH